MVGRLTGRSAAPLRVSAANTGKAPSAKRRKAVRSAASSRSPGLAYRKRWRRTAAAGTQTRRQQKVVGRKYRKRAHRTALPSPKRQAAGRDDAGGNLELIGRRMDGPSGSSIEEAVYAAGEQLLEQATPPDIVLPDIRLQDVVAAGVERLLPLGIRLLGMREVYAELDAAIRDGAPCSVVRLGDGELMTLAQDIVVPAAQAEAIAPFLPYAGVEPPDIAARDLLANAVRHASIVGIPQSRRKLFQPLLFPVLQGHGIDIRSLRLTTSTVNYGLYYEGLLLPMLLGRRLLLIGNASPALAQRLQESGYLIAGAIAPVRGFADIDRAVDEARMHTFDVALVAAGIPAVVIAWRIAEQLGKPALDFGHLADSIVKREITLQ